VPTSDLAELARLSQLTPQQLKSDHPAVFTNIARAAGQHAANALAAQLPDASEEAQDAIRSAPVDVSAHADVKTAVQAALSASDAPAAANEEAASRIASLPESSVPPNPLAMDVPVHDQPLLAPQLEAAKLRVLAQSAGLGGGKAEKLGAVATGPAALSDDVLDGLVSSGDLTQAEATSLGVAASALQLADDEPTLGETIRKRADEGGLRGLAGLDGARWTELVRSSGSTPPDGLSVDEYARVLATRVAQLAPTSALFARLAQAPRNGSSASAPSPAVKRLQEQNPDVELLALDYAPDSADVAALKRDGIAAEDEAAALATLKAYQRVYALADDVDVAASLLRAGYTSAGEVAQERLPELERRTGLEKESAARHHARASATATAVTGVVGGVVDLVAPFQNPQLSNVEPDVHDYLRRLAGYADLFGNQSYCDCADCQSILSPGAYFVDLMGFVHDHVTKPYFGSREDEPLRLSVRRPDLWTTPFTCAATNDELPTLDVIDEILENYLATSAGYAGALDDRVAIETAVYEELLSKSADSLKSPFLLPLVRLAAYLGKLGSDPAEIARVLGVGGPRLADAVLGLASRERRLVVEPETDLHRLRRLFDLPLEVASGAEHVTPFDVQDLVTAMEVSREDLGKLLESRFVAASGVAPSITADKQSAESVQNDVERVHDLTAASLDRLHRLTRLRRAAGWSVHETDLALLHTAVTALTEPDLEHVATLLALQRRLGVSLEEVCALTGPVPRMTVDGRGSMFDRLFNPLPFVAQDGRYPKNDTSFVHPAFRDPGSEAAADTTPHRLRAALGVTDDVLVGLIRGLAAPLGADLQSATERERGFALTVPNLSILYRHARLADLLGVEVPELFRLIRLAPAVKAAVGGSVELTALLDFHDWLSSGSFSLDDLDVIRRHASPDPAPADLVAGLLAGIASDQALTFADTLFAFLPGVTEEVSRSLVAANPTRVVPVGDGSAYRLATGFDLLSPLAVPPGVELDEPAARGLLASYHPSQVLPARLAGPLGTDADAIDALAGLLHDDLSSGEIPSALYGEQSPDALVALVTDLVPLVTLFRDPALGADSLAWIAQHPETVGLDDPRDVPVETAQSVAAYARFARTADTADLGAVLTAFTPAKGFATADQAQLARVLGTQPGVVGRLAEAVALPPPAADALARLADAVALAQRFGVGGDVLAQALSEKYDDLQTAADGLLAALRARYPEPTWADEIDPLEDVVRARKRDALVERLLHSSFPQFKTREDLYEHFLIDVELAGCARTSRVVAAISSVQLYVDRVQMNLEQDRRPADDPDHVHVPPSAIPAGEWAWRKNYRVWEANRKVFLWPENYLEPGLRDDRTPLFRELESTLLQQPIDEQHVLDAYSTYLAGFDGLARLRIAGAYHEKEPSGRSDVLHLFGVSPGDPPTYYHRTVENAQYGRDDATRAPVWSPWRKLDLQIGARLVSPVIVDGRLHAFWVEWTSKQLQDVSDGGSTFGGYTHTAHLKFTTLRLDDSWTAPQSVSLRGLFPFQGDGVFVDLPVGGTFLLDPTAPDAPQEDYTLRGFPWNRPYVEPGSNDRSEIHLTGFLTHGMVDLFERRVLSAGPEPSGVGSGARYPWASARGGARRLWRRPRIGAPTFAFGSLYLDADRLDRVVEPVRLPGPTVDHLVDSAALLELTPGATLEVVNGSVTDCVITVGDDVLRLAAPSRATGTYIVRRIGTTLGVALARRLYTRGVDGLLSLRFQHQLGERDLPLKLLHDVHDESVTGRLDFTGPYGVYFREIFFHIPFLLAGHLSSQASFSAARRWYQYLFDPTADDPAPDSATPRERARLRRDRVWRYLELRGLEVPSLRDVLTQPDAIEAYKADPFNPWAIARLRLSAFQKALVMRYVDNLLDWADGLFSEFTMESVGEATMLYALASSILGERPAELGSCGEGGVAPRTYAHIAPAVAKGSEFLAEIETWIVGGRQGGKKGKQRSKYGLDQVTFESPRSLAEAQGIVQGDGAGGVGRFFDWKDTRVQSWGAGLKPSVDHGLDVSRLVDDVKGFGWSLVSQISPVFCVPQNPELLRYWDRVEDRLYKIRHCMDIKGLRRQLALFAPEIDPRLLTRARAAGLSLEDVLGATSGNLPPYRFSYLIDRAKVYASTVQSFGSALLGALEKKDVEELNRLRATQSQNLLKLATQSRRWEVDAAQDAIDTLERQQATVQYRRDYFQGLADEYLSAGELAQTALKSMASDMERGSGMMSTTAAVEHLIPQVGSPFSMKYGGEELGQSASGFASAMAGAAKAFEADASMLGLLASYDRRLEGWQHQVALADHELDALQPQLAAAQIKKQIAERALQIHQTTIDQGEEILQFYADKFTNLGLYTWLSTTLQRVHREAYNGALAMARLAEQAYRFERNDEETEFLSASYWNASRGGLVAGEQLLVDLQTMERRFLETNYRSLEIEQALSLTQVDPAALVRLRQTGSCDFELPEVFFDLVYPGHFRRRIRSVRLTIPCVTGPYTNVSASLTLLGSQLRRDPDPAPSALRAVPLRRSVSIAASTAQQDAGVFEFSFRDERYMPFEGAGAVSRWRLALPRAFRPFDYRTINDVILHVAYTAESDELLRERIESENAGLEGALRHFFRENSLVRVFSLRQEFSGAFQRLLHQPAGTEVRISLGPEQFPLFLQGNELRGTRAELALAPANGQSLGAARLSVDGNEVASFAGNGDLGGLPAQDVGVAFVPHLLGIHTLSVVDPGALSVEQPAPGDESAIDAAKLQDIILRVEYHVAS
jgi:hypothetical protein